MKGNIIRLNTLHLNSASMNGVREVQGSSASGGGGIVPIPPVEPTPTYILSASVANGVVTATRNGVVVALPYTANEGDTIVLSVHPNEGYEFNGWADGNTDNPRTITMNADVALSAQCVEVVVPPSKEYIQFEDKAVEAICVANWSSDGIGLTMEDAAAVTSIGTKFKGNTEITSFNEFEYFTGVTSTDTNAFLDSTIASSAFPNSLTTIGNASFAGCTSLAIDVNAPQVTTIDKGAFLKTAIKSVYAPNLVNLYGANNLGAFASCGSLERADIGKVTSIPMQCFMYCSKLTEVVAEWDKITDVASNAFLQCSSLATFEIGASVTSIGAGAFNGCTSMQSFICRATTPPTLANANAFGSNPCVFYVPDASLEAYKTATNWSAYADRIHPLSEIEGVVIEPGYKLDSDGSLSQSSSMAVVGYVAINGGEYIRWGNSIGSLGILCEYDETYKKLDFWNGEGTGRTIRTKTSSRFVKACFPSSDLDNAYIYDETNSKYLWKGKNVE